MINKLSVYTLGSLEVGTLLHCVVCYWPIHCHVPGLYLQNMIYSLMLYVCVCVWQCTVLLLTYTCNRE